MSTSGPFHDPRMRGFRSRTSVEAVLALIDRRVERLGSESIDPRTASGRVLASDVVSSTTVPAFDRAAMDGYAVRGEETFGADPYSPIAFQLIGRVRPGSDNCLVVGPGQAAEIATGAPIPEGPTPSSGPRRPRSTAPSSASPSPLLPDAMSAARGRTSPGGRSSWRRVESFARKTWES